MKKEKVCLNRKVKTILKKVELKSDILVPDIKPDIVSIINTNGIPYVIKENVEYGKVKVEGNIESYIIYLADTGENRSISTTLSFFEVIEDERIKENSVIDVRPMIINMESKILNERKVELTIYLVLKIEISEEDEIELLSECDDYDIEKLEKNLKIKNIVSRNKVQNSLKDILKVEDNSKILEIFKVDIEVKNVETKMSFNKLLAKAEVEICLLYLDDNKCVRKINSSFPLMTFIDVQNSSDNYMVDIDYIVRNVFFKIQNEGESVEFQIDFEIQSVLYEEKEIKVIEDVYSLTKVLDVESKCVNLEMITNDEIENLVKINETYKIDNMKNLLGSEINVYKVNQKEINENINVEGEVVLKLYYEINGDNNIKINLIKVPFIYKCTNADNVNFKIHKYEIKEVLGGINLYVEIVDECNSNFKDITLINEIKVQEDLDVDDYNLIVYFVKKGDTIWNIAKKFRVTMDSIVKINELECKDKLNVGEKLYIMR